jgi:hypothetical protein
VADHLQKGKTSKESKELVTLEVDYSMAKIGTVQAFGFDSKLWTRVKTGYGPRLRRFAVQFTRKPGITVGPHDKAYKRTESVEENLELAYAVSIHKAQGSEFAHTFVIIPSSAKRQCRPSLSILR